MDNFLQSLSSKAQQLLQPVQQVSQDAINSVQKGFNNFLTGQQQQHQNQPNLYNQFSQEFQKYVPENLPVGLNTQPSPLSQILSYTPTFLQDNVQKPVNSFINNTLGSSFAGNVGRDVTNIGTGLLSLPGLAAQAGSSPQQAISVGSNLINGLVNSYKSDLGFDANNNWSLANVGQNLYQRPVSTILDALPIVGILGKAGTLGKAGQAGAAAEEAAGVAGQLGEDASNLNAASEASVLNYPKKLRELGYTQKQIDQISPIDAQDLIKNNTSPKDYDLSQTPQTPAPAKNPVLPTDEQAINKATLATENQTGLQNWLNETMGGLRGVNDSVRERFAEWINNRAAASVQAMQVAQEFKKYDSEGVQSLLDFEKNPSKYPDVQQYFKSKLAELQDAGIKIKDWGDNYIPHIYKNQDENSAFMRNLNPDSAKFTKERVIPTYAAAYAQGIEAKFSTLSDLTQWYEGRSAKLLADNAYFKNLVSQGLIQPSSKAPSGYVRLGQGFPTTTAKLPGGRSYTGSYSANPTLARAINNYLSQPNDMLSKIANTASFAKQMVLSSGIPKSGVSWHGLTEMVRNTLFSSNPISAFFRGTGYLLNPRLAEKYINANLSTATEFVKSGGNLSIEDFHFTQQAAETSGVLAKAAAWQEEMFSKDLFQTIIPAMKLQYYNQLKGQLANLGEQAARTNAARITNDLYGGQNLAQLARSRVTSNVFRSVLFAPDFLESNFNNAKGLGAALMQPTNPLSKPYLTFARNFIMSYVALNMANLASSGHLAIDNPDPGHEFDLFAGYTNDAQARYVRIYGSGVDFLRVPQEFLSGMMRGSSQTMVNAVQNRLSVPISAATHQFSGQNYLGQNLYKPNASLPQQAVGRGIDVANTFLPPQVSNAARYLTGNQGGEQSLAAGLQMPVRYAGGARTQAQQSQLELMQSGGASGREINTALSQARLQTQNNRKFNQQPSIFDSLFQYLGIPKSDPSKTLKSEQTGDPLLDALNHQANLDAQAATIKAIYTSGETPDQINLTLQKQGIDASTAKEIMLKSLDTQARSDVLQSMFSEIKTPQQYTQTIGELARRQILTSSIVANWQENGIIDSQQAKNLDNAIKLSKNQKVTSVSAAGTGRRILAPQRPPAIAIPYRPMNLSMSTQGMNTPKLKAYPKQQSQPAPSYNNIFNAPMPNPNLDSPIATPKTQGFNLRIPKVNTIM